MCVKLRTTDLIFAIGLFKLEWVAFMFISKIFIITAMSDCWDLIFHFNSRKYDTVLVKIIRKLQTYSLLFLRITKHYCLFKVLNVRPVSNARTYLCVNIPFKSECDNVITSLNLKNSIQGCYNWTYLKSNHTNRKAWFKKKIFNSIIICIKLSVTKSCEKNLS